MISMRELLALLRALTGTAIKRRREPLLTDADRAELARRYERMGRK